MTPLQELQKMRDDLAGSLLKAEAEERAGLRPMLNKFDRAERAVIIQHLDQRIELLVSGKSAGA